jgi:protein ImuA
MPARLAGLKSRVPFNNRALRASFRNWRYDTVYLISIILSSLPIKAIKPLEGIADIWHADELATTQGQTVSTGDAALNAQLPGGGWPVGALIEILQAQSGHNDWRLLLPALCKTSGVLVLVGAPHGPFAPGLAGQGLNPERLLRVTTATPASRLWATEQALRCKDVAAVLAWLPQARADPLRRLQIAAAEHHKLLFVMRPARAQNESSPAVLRLVTATARGSDALLVSILKRRGPPLAQALALVARPARLGALLAVGVAGQSDTDAQAARAQVERDTQEAQEEQETGAELLNFPLERSDALDRVAA